MKLTIDKVREVLADIERGSPPRTATVRTLCEAWIAARTARVIHCGVHGFALDAGSGERLAYVEVTPGYWRGVHGTTDTGWRADGDPCAWLEEQARAAGYEVEGGA